MVAIPLSSIHGGVREGSETHGDSKFVGFGRVFAGIMKKGDKILMKEYINVSSFPLPDTKPLFRQQNHDRANEPIFSGEKI